MHSLSPKLFNYTELFTNIIVFSSDTVVLSILLNYFEDHSICATFKTTRLKCNLLMIHKSLSSCSTKAVIGLHVLSRCNQTNKNCGYGKKTCWDTQTHQSHIYIARAKFLPVFKLRLNLDGSSYFLKRISGCGKPPPTLALLKEKVL